ncbi:MAG: poly-gamma-glutamate system protein [Paludibacteraceae bacterium]
MKLLEKINLRSNTILVSLALLCLLGLLIVEKSKVMRKKKWYDEKLAAAQLSKSSAEKLKAYFYGDVEFVDNLNDPNETGLIGHEYSPITSERGSFVAKATSFNPNFAGLVVGFLKELKLKEGDNVALGVTGSFPGLNLAVYSALQTLKLKPTIICSVTSSGWGANDPDFTWLDMDRVLKDSANFSFKAIAATMGASQDLGRGLSNEGVEYVNQAIQRNHVQLLKFNNMNEDVEKRMELYLQQANGSPIKAYINVGGGVASIGSDKNRNVIASGLNEKMNLSSFIDKKGVIFEMAKKEIPVIQMLDVRKLASEYKLPINPIPLPEPGDGPLFQEEKYNMWVVGIVTFILLVVISFIIYQDKKNVKLGKDILRSENESSENELIL